MKRLLLPIVLSIFIIGDSKSQSDDISKKPAKDMDNKNSIFFELGGNAPLVSLNFEQRILKYDFVSIYSRIGVGVDIIDFRKKDLVIPSIPLEISATIGSMKHKFELGLGITPFYSKIMTWTPDAIPYDLDIREYEYDLFYLLISRLGYRFETSKSWTWRAAYTPIIYNSSYKKDFYFAHNIGISVGKGLSRVRK